jgi:hypothetical protein
MDYKIVIPSYNRPDVFKNKTLKFLQKHNINMNNVFLFVSCDAQKELYKDCGVSNIIEGIIGLSAQRNFITNYFPVGQKLVSFDDDVIDLVELDVHNKLIPLESLESLIKEGFDLCRMEGANLWGVYPTPNAFYMKKSISTDFKFIIGRFWGIINPGPVLHLHDTHGSKEDYIRCIMMWQLDKKLVRMNYVAIKSATYKSPGGLNTSERGNKEREAVAYILRNYSQYVKLNKRRKSEFPEILLIKQKK